MVFIMQKDKNGRVTRAITRGDSLGVQHLANQSFQLKPLIIRIKGYKLFNI